jgi:tRNA wybutosine-synthesizing protein 3
MAATLHHAHPVLAAASSSGFRESGLQSLRCLDDDGVSPVVAVRSSGLALESVIGYCDESSDGESPDSDPTVRSLVSEDYLRMLVDISNERFGVNTERKKRFRAVLLDLCSRNQGRKDGWEDPEDRRERKRAEGLRRQQEAQQSRQNEMIESDQGDVSDSDELGSFF